MIRRLEGRLLKELSALDPKDSARLGTAPIGLSANPDSFLRFNPDHRPAGPGGGQFAPSDTASQNKTPRIRVKSVGNDLILEDAGGSVETRRGGSLAWRNNNPGNMILTPRSRQLGAIGQHEKFAVFPDERTGEAAQRALLTSNYSEDTLDQAIKRWAPKKTNNTARYQSLMRNWTGLAGGTKIGDLTPSQVAMVMAAQRRMEGWATGTVIRTSP